MEADARYSFNRRTKPGGLTMAKLKRCQVGNHDVEKLFHREIPGERKSCCSLHRPKKKIELKVGDYVKKSGRGNYKAFARIVSINPSPPEQSLTQPLIDMVDKINLAALKKKKARPKEESLPDLLKRAEKVFNKWIRNRDTRYDKTFVCMACKKWQSSKEMDAGHYLPVGKSATRFHPYNVHGCCHECNRFNYGNLEPYRINLIEVYGLKKVKELESLAEKTHKWERSELLDIITKFS